MNNNNTEIIAVDKERMLDSTDTEKLGLQKDKKYALRFLYNTELNQAGDPLPFKIKPELADKLAKDFVGTPWILPPKIDLHLKGEENYDDYKNANPQKLLEYQTQYAIGKAVSTFKNKDTNNYYAVYEIWPEYQDVVESGKYPYTSITLGNARYENDKQTIYDAQPLNLQTVKFPGYAPHLASIQGVCSNGIKQCIRELSVLGASGHLENTKKTDIKRFSNIVLGVVGAMSQTEQTQLMSPEEMNTAIQALMKGFEELKAAIAEMKGGSQGGETGVTGASGNTTTKQVQQLDTSELDQLKKDFTDIQAQQKILVKENERLQAEKRHATAKTIVDKLIKNKSLKDEDKDETIKYYVEKKNEDGSLVDLDLVAETLEKVPDFSENEQIVGASGNPSSGYSLQMNNNTKLDNKQVYGSTISRLYRGGSQ